MKSSAAVDALAALAQEARLAIFRLLVETGPDGLPVGEIAAALSIPAATLSFHLVQLKGAGLVTCRRNGRQLIHAANYPRMNGLIAFLTENCCNGDPAVCMPARAPAKPCIPAKPPRRRKTAAR